MTKIIALSSKKGGAGKSTLCQCLAVASSGGILDVDPQMDSFAWAAQRKKHLGHSDEVPVMRGSPHEIRAQASRLGTEYVFIDTPPLYQHTKDRSLVWQAADLVVVPVQTSAKSIRSALSTMKDLDDAMIRYRGVLLVSNVVARAFGGSEKILDEQGVNVLPTRIVMRTVYELSSFSGRTPLELWPFESLRRDQAFMERGSGGCWVSKRVDTSYRIAEDFDVEETEVEAIRNDPINDTGPKTERITFITSAAFKRELRDFSRRHDIRQVEVLREGFRVMRRKYRE